MPIPKKVENYLKKNEKTFEAVAHKTVYTAYDLSKTLKAQLKDIAKSLVVKADKTFVLAVVPASARVNLPKLKKALGAKKVSIPDEKIMVKMFKVKPGAISAFGKLHKVEVVVDKGLAKAKKVILQSGSFTDSVRMKVKDFIEMEDALLAQFAEAAKFKKPKDIKTKKQKNKGKKGTKSKNKTTIKKKVVKKKPVKKKVTVTNRKPVGRKK